MPINFNGQEYGSLESMPADVRRSYQEALSGLVDATRTSVPNSALARALMPRGHSEHFLRVHHRTKRTVAWKLPALLALALGGMLTAGAWLLQPMTVNDGGQGADPSSGPGLMIAVAIHDWCRSRHPVPLPPTRRPEQRRHDDLLTGRT